MYRVLRSYFSGFSRVIGFRVMGFRVIHGCRV